VAIHLQSEENREIAILRARKRLNVQAQTWITDAPGHMYEHRPDRTQESCTGRVMKCGVCDMMRGHVTVTEGRVLGCWLLRKYTPSGISFYESD
jgi:ferredoxin-like protein FixX